MRSEMGSRLYPSTIMLDREQIDEQSLESIVLENFKRK